MVTLNKSKTIFVLKHIQNNIVFFIEKILGCLTLLQFQKDLAKIIQKYDKVTIRACHSMGKTFLVARVALWFLFSFKGAKVITTAPTYRQVELLLWGEIRKAKKNSKILLGGKQILTKTEIDDDWFGIGFSPRDKAGEGDDQKGSTFQGWHSRYICVIFDEAAGISADVFKMAEGLMASGIIVKWICIGNPTTRSSMFFRLFKMADWKGVKISCFDSPNMIVNGFINLQKVEDELSILRCMNDDARLKRIKNYKKPAPDMLSAQWAIAKFYDWGPTHPLTMSKVLAEFPDTDDYAIVSFDNVQRAINRELPVPEKRKAIRYIGVDVARFGINKTVFTELMGYKQTGKETLNKADNVQTAGELTRFINNNPHYEVVVVIDGTGVGGGVIDIMRQNKRQGVFRGLPKITIVEVHFNQTIDLDDKEKEKQMRKIYDDLKAYMFAKLNEDLRDHIDLMEEEVYEGQLPSIRFRINSKGKIVIEGKEDFEARTGLKSPDESDSLALANIGRHLQLASGKFRNQPEKPPTNTFYNRDSLLKSRRTIKVPEY